MSLRLKMIFVLLFFLVAIFSAESVLLVSQSLRAAQDAFLSDGQYIANELVLAVERAGRPGPLPSGDALEQLLRERLLRVGADFGDGKPSGQWSVLLTEWRGNEHGEQTLAQVGGSAAGEVVQVQQVVYVADEFDGYTGRPRPLRLYLSIPVPRFSDILPQIYRELLIALSFTLLLGVILFSLLNFIYLRPVLALRRATEELAEGNFDTEIDVRTGDELEELAASFRVMVERLEAFQEMALDSNPLTGLPGNTTIHARLEELIGNRSDANIIYVDLDNFKAFNDVYGFEAGDWVISFAATVFVETLEPYGDATFVGHVGGDDFVIIVPAGKTAEVCEKIIDRFDDGILGFYNEEDRRQGGIVAKDRQGNEQRFGFVSVSLACLDLSRRQFNRVPELAAAAAEVKKLAKKTEGSVFVVDRRT